MERYTMMVESSCLSIEGGFEVTGKLYGEAKEGDTVFVIVPGFMHEKAKIAAISVEKKEEKFSAVRMVITGLPMDLDLKKYTVITSIEPQRNGKLEKAIENPMIVGLAYNYVKNLQDPVFQNIMMHEIVGANLLTQVFINEDIATHNENMTIDPGVGFIALPYPNDPSKKVLPMFTDWTTLEAMPKDPKMKLQGKTMLCRFEETYGIMKNRRYDAVVINPFGPAAVVVPSSLMDNLHVIVLKMIQDADEAKARVAAKKAEQEKNARNVMANPENQQ